MTSPVLMTVPAEKLEEYWPQVRELIAQSCERSGGRYAPVDLMREILGRAAQLWTAERDGKVEAIMLTRLVNYPQARICEAFVCVGAGMEEWLAYLSTAEQWARENGCKRFVPIARKGWAKVLAARGYELTHVVLEKVL